MPYCLLQCFPYLCYLCWMRATPHLLPTLLPSTGVPPLLRKMVPLFWSLLPFSVEKNSFPSATSDRDVVALNDFVWIYSFIWNRALTWFLVLVRKRRQLPFQLILQTGQSNLDADKSIYAFQRVGEFAFVWKKKLTTWLAASRKFEVCFEATNLLQNKHFLS